MISDLEGEKLVKLARDSIVNYLKGVETSFEYNVRDWIKSILKNSPHLTEHRYGYDKVGIIGIMIDENVMQGLEAKTLSVFNPVRVYFPPYSQDEVCDILSNRVKYGLYEGVIGKSLVEYVSEKTAEQGDLRVGIDLIRRAALLAERDAKRNVDKSHVEEAYEKDSQKLDLIETVKALSKDEKKLLGVIALNDGEKSGAIYDKMRDAMGLGVKRYNEMLKKLEHCKLIDTVAASGRGQTRFIRLRNTQEDVEKALKK